MIKCGIIGCGVIAPTHIEGYRKLQNAEVAALCDVIPERAAALGEKYGIANQTTDYHKLLADPEIQLVSICTDHASHAQIAVDALNAGKNVICEKSLGRVPADLDRMVAAAKSHPELVASGIFQHRFEPHNIAFRDLIKSGDFGRPLMLDLAFACLRTADYYNKDNWRGTFEGEGGGVLINQAIHFLDQLRFVFGEVKAVTSLTANQTHTKVIDVEDAAVFTIEFESGLIGTVSATSSSCDAWRIALTVTSDLARLEYDNEVATRVVAVTPELKSEIASLLASDAAATTVSAGKSYYGGGHTDQLADVLDAIEKHREPTVTFAEAANTSSLVFAVYESARRGGRVEVKNYR